ncbi:MAG: sigma-54-dependent Fis family transcriptional regulator [Pseudomonadota bacterium]
MTSAIGQQRTIEQAHQRSALHGRYQEESPDAGLLGGAALQGLIAQNQVLYGAALPLMETLYAQIAGTRHMVILCDVNGVILHVLGDPEFLARAERIALLPGAAWSEARRGTNAIGTAIVEELPTRVDGSEHYLRALHFLSSAAAPIFDAQGLVVGVLDVAGELCDSHRHTMALVRMAAQLIENQLFSLACAQANLLQFHVRPELIGTPMEGRAAFTPTGRFLAVNRAGQSQLGLAWPALALQTMTSLLGLSMEALYEHSRRALPELLPLCLGGGVKGFGRLQLRPPREGTSEAPSAARAPARPARRMNRLRDLATGDPQLEQVIGKLEKVAGLGIPIILAGETGTGKEWMAQAIHHDSPRAAGPFVAVNCAAIPEELIESELFGYEDGAFTGARKKGAIGKILQSHGGTLFLDEIGDMPLGLQARLLRVLQERTVTPLGGNRSIAVDVEVICATNRTLREMIAQGRFREDLYYRLNGLVVKLPPLRERHDLASLVRAMLARGPGTAPHTLAPAVMALFVGHSWPGNLRQLDNLLRTARVMAEADGEAGREIGLQHLPADFLDDVQACPAPGPALEPCVAPGASLEQAARATILASLAAHGDNVSATAKALGISRNTIYRKKSAMQLWPGGVALAMA